MIIPKISAADFSTDARGQQQLIECLRHWSLFGVVAIGNTKYWPIAQLEAVLQAVGGSVDVEVELVGQDEESAIAWLNAGATKILGTAAEFEILDSIPDHCRIQFGSLDATVVSAGEQLELAQPTADELARLEHLGMDVLVAVQHLESQPNLIADFFQQILLSDRADGLWPTVIVDPLGLALGLVYSNYESLLDAITHRRGTYWSRSRGELWIKGATSGATQKLLGLRIDCDRDCLRFQVTQDPPGFCHHQTHSCFGAERTIVTVIERLRQRVQSAEEQSFTRKLANDPAMLRIKLLEEAGELADATTNEQIAFEAADVLYFSLVKMLSAGVRLETIHQELARRMTRIVRRKNKLEP